MSQFANESRGLLYIPIHNQSLFFFKVTFLLQNKGQLISKCAFAAFKSSKKNNENVSRISALAPKKKVKSEK